MKKLTPEQARLIRLKAREQLAWPEAIQIIEGKRIAAMYDAVLDELTAKPEQKEHCEDCRWWKSLGFCMGCLHPNFTPGVCPMGRWEEK